MKSRSFAGAAGVLALLAGGCGPGEAPPQNEAASDMNAMIQNEAQAEDSVPAPAQAEPPAASPKATTPPRPKPAPRPAPKPVSEPAPETVDPHAGHDMNNMSN